MSKPSDKVRAIRLFTAIFMTVFLSAVTWPGFLLFNRTSPIVLGLPFNLFCIALFIVIGMAVLVLLYWAEEDG